MFLTASHNILTSLKCTLNLSDKILETFLFISEILCAQRIVNMIFFHINKKRDSCLKWDKTKIQINK